jgi:hypothetical protein
MDLAVQQQVEKVYWPLFKVQSYGVCSKGHQNFGFEEHLRNLWAEEVNVLLVEQYRLTLL